MTKQAERSFVWRLFIIATPILLQNMLSASLNFIDVFMIGSLGETSVAAVGSANQFFFVFNMLVFGLASGSAIFTSQYWGAREIKNIRTVMGIGIRLTLGIALIFTLSTFLFPEFSIRIFSPDAAVVALGSDYIRIIAFTFLLTALSINYAVVLRSTENVIYPMIGSFVGVITNTVLNYILIFGKFGAPQLGVAGAAYATLIARILETTIILALTYLRKLPAAIRLSDILVFPKDLFVKYIKRVLPVVLQSVGWSAGFSMYAVIYGHISTDFLSAFNISGSIERLCLIFFTGIGSACSIMVGNRIGAGELKKARAYARYFLMIGLGMSIVLSIVLIWARIPISSLYSNLSLTSQSYVRDILLVIAIVMWAKASNIIFHMGIFRAGGDTVFSMIVDVGGVWLVGVPIAAIAGFLLHLPIPFIFAAAAIEEVTKMIVGMIRYRSGRWMNRLVEPSHTEETLSEEIAV
jgi:putative MATE family efflux protein